MGGWIPALLNLLGMGAGRPVPPPTPTPDRIYTIPGRDGSLTTFAGADMSFTAVPGRDGSLTTFAVDTDE